MKLGLDISILLVAVVVAFFAGTYAEKTVQKARDRDQLITMMAKQRDAIADLTELNIIVANTQSALLNKQDETRQAVQGIKGAIRKTNVGGCSLTPDADKLRQQTYQATAGSVSK